ncbi:MAG: primary-amine oxidase [Pseudonocardiaceae bacterium]|nr:primary-amine oxidase [Pseudonocardiaceae bacterium]
MTRVEPAATAVKHPLEPLTAAEITAAVDVLRAERGLTASTRFVSIALREPAKEAIRDGEGAAVDREAFVIALNLDDGLTYEGAVSLTDRAVRSWEAVPGVQAQVTMDEFFACEEIVKNDPGYREALAARGITDTDTLMVDPWSAGNYGDEVEGRLLRALSWVRLDGPDDNGYAHPVENLIAYVDLHARRVAKIEDHGVVPVPRAPGNYTPDAAAPLRHDLRPLEITQPEGTSITVDGHEVGWQKWRLRVGFTPREGLVLHTVSYQDRSVLHRASLAEMVVPYGDPAPTHSRKNAFDAGEYNIGALANSLELGCDCLGEIHYFDAVLADCDGEPVTLRNAVCLHEEDYGLLWKHFDFRTEKAETRRSRRLVISFVATVGNYEYGFYWYLYQDGTIQCEVKLTGIMSTGAVAPGQRPSHGQLLTSEGLYAPIHQHFLNFRLDFDVDGPHNSVQEVHTEADPPGPGNPLGNAFRSRATVLARESQAQQVIDPLSARTWKVINPSVRNAVGEPVGYRLVPGANVLPFAAGDASVSRRAAFATKHLWVTPYRQAERHPAGDYPNQHAGGAGLPEWTRADRPIEDTDVVVWYTLGSHHSPRLEDWPVMPVQYAGFTLAPDGFFDHSPALDVPPPSGDGHCTP